MITLPPSLASELGTAGIREAGPWLKDRIHSGIAVTRLPAGWWIIPVKDKGRWSHKGVALRFTQEGLKVAQTLWSTADGKQVPGSELVDAIDAYLSVPLEFRTGMPPQLLLPATAEPSGAVSGHGGDWVRSILMGGGYAIATAPDRVLVIQPGMRAAVVRLFADHYAVSLFTQRFERPGRLGQELTISEHAVERLSARLGVQHGNEASSVRAALGSRKGHFSDFGWFGYYVDPKELVLVLGRTHTGWRCVTAYKPTLVDAGSWSAVLQAMAQSGFNPFNVDRDHAESSLVGDTFA